jgi:hypothetical protein
MGVGAHMKRVKVHENSFARYYGLSINHDQKKGTAWDCVIPTTGERIEFKADLMAAKTGNHFVEFRYSNDEGTTWDDSGIVLAAEQADYWVIFTGEEYDEYHWFDPADIIKYVEKNKPAVKEIRRNLYGNSGKIRCEGWIIPLEDLYQLEVEPPLEPVNLVDLW